MQDQGDETNTPQVDYPFSFPPSFSPALFNPLPTSFFLPFFSADKQTDRGVRRGGCAEGGAAERSCLVCLIPNAGSALSQAEAWGLGSVVEVVPLVTCTCISHRVAFPPQVKFHTNPPTCSFTALGLTYCGSQPPRAEFNRLDGGAVHRHTHKTTRGRVRRDGMMCPFFLSWGGNTAWVADMDCDVMS